MSKVKFFQILLARHIPKEILTCRSMSNTIRPHDPSYDHFLQRQEEIAKERQMIRVENPVTGEIEVSRSAGYFCPDRINHEEKSLWNGVRMEAWSQPVNYQYYTQLVVNGQLGFSYWTDNHHFHWNRRIKRYEDLVDRQSFIRERLTTLGPDLSAAHFLLARGCRIRFRDDADWIESTRQKDVPDPFGVLPDTVPSSYEPGYYVEAIDASDSNLVYEGITNIRNLVYLKHLDLSYCMEIDAFCMDRITGEFADSLEFLDISGCRNLDWNGLECIWRLYRLKTLVLRDMEHVKDIKLICLLLLDVLPDLEIRGVDYLDTMLLKGTEDEDLMRDTDLNLLPDITSSTTN